MLSRNLLFAAVFAAGGALAQTTARPAAQTAPQAGTQAAPPLKYESTFIGYQPYRDDKRGDWRELNETVGVLGGHNAHLRGAVQVVNSQGTVIEVDKTNARVRIDHEAIRELGWPAATAFWPLKNAALADKIKPGERIGFRLELAGDSYKIANVGPAGAPAAKTSPENPHAGHNMVRPPTPAAPAKPSAPPVMPGMPPGHKM